MSGTRKLATLAALLLAAAMSACTSNGDGGSGGGGGGGSIDGSSSGGGPSNGGNGPTNITQGGNPVTGHFVCTTGARAYGDVTTAVGANGLVGGPLSTLLTSLGGTTAVTLLNSVTQPDNVIDGKLSTYATFALTAGLIQGTLDSVDLSVLFPPGTTVPAGKYAVYGLSFPNGTVNLSLLNSVTVATYLNNVQQESNTLTSTLLLGLLGQGAITEPAVWLGVKTTKPYDRATVLLTPGVISADVGDAMHVYELCVDGTLQ
jgi:hypothetical protein